MSHELSLEPSYIGFSVLWQALRIERGSNMKIMRDIKGITTPMQLFALLPFFTGDKEDMRLRTCGRLYGFVVMLGLLVSSTMFCQDVLFASQEYKLLSHSQGETEEINRTIETLFCICSYTMIAVSCVHNGSKHFRTLREIAKIDEYLEVNGFNAKYSCRFLGTLLAIASASVVVVAFYYIHYLSDITISRQCILILIYSLQMIYSFMFALYLRTILMNLTQRIEFLNQRLDEFTKDEKNTFDKENWRELSNLIEIFCKFRYITENMNAVTGVALLFYMGFAFYTVTNQSYLAFSTLTTPTQLRKNYDTMGLSCAWVLAETTTMSMICSSCDCLASEACGLLPIYEQISSYEVGPPTRTNEFYSFFVRGVIHALTIFNIYSLFTSSSAQLFSSYRDTDNVNQWIEILLCILTYTLTVFICARNAKVFLRIMNDILRLDEEVRRQFGVKLTTQVGCSVKLLVVIALCQAYIIVLKIHGVDGEITPTSYILIGFYAVQNGLSITFILFAAALLKIVTIRFKYINELLNGYTYVQQQQKHVGTTAASMEHFPDDSLFVYRMHNKLLRIYKTINECCSLILVGYMGYAFYTITTNTYNLFVQITTKGMVSPNILQWCFAWLFMHTTLLALLSRSCGQATREANTTSQILARVYGKSKEFQNIIDKFLTKSIKQDVQFTAYGFFVIDNSTLFKIFSAVTTYLVILIQFKQLEDSKLEDSAT